VEQTANFANAQKSASTPEINVSTIGKVFHDCAKSITQSQVKWRSSLGPGKTERQSSARIRAKIGKLAHNSPNRYR
jgi:hypothetical protein